MRKHFRFSRIVSMENYRLGRKMLSLGVSLYSLTRAHELSLTSNYEVEMYGKQTEKLEKKKNQCLYAFHFLWRQKLGYIRSFSTNNSPLFSILFKLL